MDRKTEIFEAARPRLMGLGFRMLGSVSDAQDAVQDTYIKWVSHEGPAIKSPAAWLARVCTNGCLDRLKAADRSRVDYVGPWLPDQIQTEYEAGPEVQLEIAASLTTAFLLMLERLTPKERAAYLLHDIFDMPFDEVAAILDLHPANCRKLAARARGFVTKNQVRHIPEETRQTELLAGFQEALSTGSTEGLVRMLRADADLRADSGGKVIAIRHVIQGRTPICAFVSDVLSPAWHKTQMSAAMINGTLGLLVKTGDKVHATVSFACDSHGKVRHVFIMRHPDKLALLNWTRGRASESGALWVQ